MPSVHAVPSVVKPLRTILMVAIEEPVGLEIVAVELDEVVCVLPTAMAPPVNVCWALAAKGRRVTNARANRLNFRPVERRANAEIRLNETIGNPTRNKRTNSLD